MPDPLPQPVLAPLTPAAIFLVATIDRGCYVHVQKYVHDMGSWNSLSTEEQERVIGRTKHDDIELDDAVKPANSHVALNVIEDDAGNEFQDRAAIHAVR